MESKHVIIFSFWMLKAKLVFLSGRESPTDRKAFEITDRRSETCYNRPAGCFKRPAGCFQHAHAVKSWPVAKLIIIFKTRLLKHPAGRLKHPAGCFNVRPDVWNIRPDVWNIRPDVWNVRPDVRVINVTGLSQSATVTTLYPQIPLTFNWNSYCMLDNWNVHKIFFSEDIGLKLLHVLSLDTRDILKKKNVSDLYCCYPLSNWRGP